MNNIIRDKIVNLLYAKRIKEKDRLEKEEKEKIILEKEYRSFKKKEIYNKAIEKYIDNQVSLLINTKIHKITQWVISDLEKKQKNKNINIIFE